MKKLLFITNGHGEDLVAVEIIKRLNGVDIQVLPLVGEGTDFAALNVKVIGSRRKLPSGGFSLRNFGFLIKDLFAGLLGNTLGNLRLLHALKGEIDFTIAIGD